MAASPQYKARVILSRTHRDIEIIAGVAGLHGKLIPIRDWDYPDNAEKFWPAFERKVASVLGRKLIRAMRRVNGRSADGHRVTYEVTLVGGARRGHRSNPGGGGNIYGTCLVTTARLDR